MEKLIVGYLYMYFVAFSIDVTVFGQEHPACDVLNAQDTCSSMVSEEIERMPMADGNFHFYALPVGQGDAQVLQCPNGDIAIVDLGSSDGKGKGFWTKNEIRDFLQGHFDHIKNIVVTHNDKDHYNLFKDVFSSASELRQLSNIFISCTREAIEGTLNTWIEELEYRHNNSIQLRTFNGGRVCWPSDENKTSCAEISLCPENSDIKVEVLTANAGDCNSTGQKYNYNKNMDSIVIRIEFNNFTMLLTGDFEGDMQQTKMVDIYRPRSRLNVTVYKLAHHGANSLANKGIMLDAVKPKAVFVSSNPWFTYRHPKCNITNYITNVVKSLCKPEETDLTSDFYCGEHPMSSVNKLQKVFSCGNDSEDKKTGRWDPVTIEDNTYAIYSTTPSLDTINLVHLVTNGAQWGFVNNIFPCSDGHCTKRRKKN